jgi:hypothetical protein
MVVVSSRLKAFSLAAEKAKKISPVAHLARPEFQHLMEFSLSNSF